MEVEKLTSWLVGIYPRTVMVKPNEADEGAMLDLKRLINKARSSIKVVSGELPFEVYCQNGVVDVVKRALNRRCSAEVVVGPQAEERSLDFLVSLGVSVRVLEQWPLQHFVVVDGKHVRLEEPHDPGQEKRKLYTVYNFKYARQLENRFDALKKQAKVWKVGK